MLSSLSRRTTVLCCGSRAAAALSQPTCAALRSRPVLLNQLRTHLSREDELRHQQFEQANAARGVRTPPMPSQAGAPEAGGRREEEERPYEGREEYDEFPEDRPSRFKVFARFLRIFVAGLGWVLFFSSIHNTKEIFAFLEFLDVAFPRKLLAPYVEPPHPISTLFLRREPQHKPPPPLRTLTYILNFHSRVCFDLMPPDEKMKLVGEFRRKQAYVIPTPPPLPTPRAHSLLQPIPPTGMATARACSTTSSTTTRRSCRRRVSPPSRPCAV